MKIFNWVHRRFNHNHGLTENVKKCGGDEKQFLLEESDVIIGGVYGGWKGGILAIGTFGYNPLISYEDDDNDDDDDDDQISNLHDDDDQKQEMVMQENDDVKGDYEVADSKEHEEYDDEEEEEEVNPLMYAVHGHGDYEGLMKGGNEEGRVLGSGDCGKEKFDEYDRSENVEMKRERERTTLAELFSVDSENEEMTHKKGVKKVDEGGEMMKPKSGGNKYAKKMIGGDNARPAIHKLNRLMRRMLKRKIHPDVNCSNSIPN